MNQRLMHQHIVQTTGKVVTVKDIHNLRAAMNGKYDVTDVLNEFAASSPDDVRLVVDSDNTVRQILIQTAAMKETFAKFPEVMLLDDTYSINNCGMPLYAFIVEDGYGKDQLVGLFLLSGEGSAQMKTMVELFRNANPTVTETKTIIIDKDFSEISATEAGLPHVDIQLCTFHCIKVVQKKVGSLPLDLSSKTQLNSLYCKLIYAKNDAEFDAISAQIKAISSDFDLEEHLYNAKNRWVQYMKNVTSNLGNTTTNRIESLFAKLKQIVKSKVSLSVCLRQLLQLVQSTHLQSDYRHFCTQTKLTYSHRLGSDVNKYHTTFTRYACDTIARNVKKRKSSELPVTSINDEHVVRNNRTNASYTVCNCLTCSCLYFSSQSLPCKHVFAHVLSHNYHCTVYSTDLVPEHWLLSYQTHAPLPLSEGHHQGATTQLPEVSSKRRCLTTSEQYKSAERCALALADVVSCAGMTLFRCRLCQALCIDSFIAYGWKITFTFLT